MAKRKRNPAEGGGPKLRAFKDYRDDQYLLSNLRQAFEKHGPLDVADTIGILTVINNSVGAWNRGMRGQEYLKYIREFLGGMGVTVREISETEAKTMLLEPAEDDDSPPPPKKKFLGLV